MSEDDVYSKTDALKRAIQWISEARVDQPTRSMRAIVDEAGPRFNLTAAQTELLWQTFVSRPTA